MRRLLRWRVVLPAGAVLLLALFALAAWPGKATYTVSPETTHVVGPLDANGRVDYPAALHERRSKGIDPDKNAMVLIVQAIGPKPEGSEVPGLYYDWLGTTRPPDDGVYLVRHTKFITDVIRPVAERRVVFDDDEPPFVGPPESDDAKDDWLKRFNECRKAPWSPTSEPRVAEWLTLIDKPLSIAAEASRRPQWYHPMASKSADARAARLLAAPLSGLQSCREIATALVTRSMMRAKSDDFNGAWADLQASQRLGRLISRGTTLIEHLVGLAICTLGTTGEVSLLGAADHPPERLRTWQEDARSLPPLPPLADIVDLGERHMVLDAMQAIALGADLGKFDDSLTDSPFRRPPGTLFSRSIDFDPGFARANSTFDRLSSAAQIKDRVRRRESLAEIEQDITAAKVKAVADLKSLGLFEGAGDRGERLAWIAINFLVPAVGKMLDSDDRIEQQFRNRDVAIALARYKADTGAYPAALTELAPKYLPTVPDDLFNGKPLTYRLEGNGYLLYSVGVNEVDDGGHDRDDVRVRVGK